MVNRSGISEPRRNLKPDANPGAAPLGRRALDPAGGCPTVQRRRGASMPERSARFEAWVAPARQAPQLWRLLAGVGLAVLGWTAAFALALIFPPARHSEAGILIAYLLS